MQEASQRFPGEPKTLEVLTVDSWSGEQTVRVHICHSDAINCRSSTPLTASAGYSFTYFACGPFEPREVSFTPTTRLERSRYYGFAHDYPQKQTEGEGDARPLSVNLHLRIARTAEPLISRIRAVDSIMLERRPF